MPLLQPGDVVEERSRRPLRRAALDRTSARSTATRASRCVRRPKPTRRRSRSARPATASSSGRSRKSTASRGSGRDGCSAARSTTCCRSAPRATTARRSTTTPTRRAWRSRGSARPRSPTARTSGPGSPLPGPRIFLNTLPDGESESGAEFLGASIVDTEVPGGTGGDGRAAEHRHRRKPRNLRLLYDANGMPRVVEGNDQGLSGTLSLGPSLRRLRTGRGERDEPGRRRRLGLAERRRARPPGGRRARGLPRRRSADGLVSGGAGGEVGELAVGRSGLGDGLVAFRQGPIGRRGDRRRERGSAPPAPFVLTAPKGWIRPSQASSRGSSDERDGPLSYRSWSTATCSPWRGRTASSTAPDPRRLARRPRSRCSPATATGRRP